MLDRFFIDQRSGCIAIKDRILVDLCYKGLHPDTIGVIWFKTGMQGPLKFCKKCGHKISDGDWNIPDKFIKEAQKICNALNIENNHKGYISKEKAKELVGESEATYYDEWTK